ncbi:MAG: hypothetical protein LBI28_08140 [Treponema sp.]|jgi:hypothetical protein|nr:hypothetical protein [Treponema sp.]
MSDVNDLNADLNEREDLIRATKTIIQLYTDKAHFIYELLQNAEDCKATKVSFTMFPDRLEVLHNGEPFTQANLTSIRSVALTTKIEEVNAIGKFGVGFKSVFGICKTVFLICEPSHYKEQKKEYLPGFAYKIEDFRYLSPLGKSEDDINLPDEYTTKYIFPLCVSEDFSGYKTIEALHENLSKRLRKLGTSVLLFMRNIEEISYSVTEISGELNCNGTYLLEKKKIGENCFRITGIGENDIDDVSYLMYSRPTCYKKDINIAFACEWGKDGVPVFSFAPEKNICVYFPTDTASNVNFVVQAPYGTTPNRGGIPGTEENFYLSDELAALLHDAILDIRDRKWLTLKFLNFLPLDNNKNYGFLQSLHKKVITLINEERLLLTINEDDYVTRENAHIVRGEKIADLFSDEKLCSLVGNQKAKWLPTYFTATAPDLAELHNVLTKQFLVKETGADELPALLRNNTNFLKQIDNKWLVSFYEYLLKEQRGKLGKGQEFSTVPMIKTKSDEFVESYTYDRSKRTYTQKVFVYPKNASKAIRDFNFVDEFIVRECQEFLDAMNIVEPEGYDYLIGELTSRSNDEKISEKEEISQLKRAIKFLKEESHANAVDEFRNKIFLRYFTTDDDKVYLGTCSSGQLYCGIDSVLDISIMEYFSGVSCNIGILDEEFYVNNGITKIDLQVLSKLGVKNTVVNFGKDNWYEGNASCTNNGSFKKWLNFDYIYDVLSRITNGEKSKSALLFRMLKKVENNLKGVYLRGVSRQDRIPDESDLLKIIKLQKWLYSSNGNFVKASYITRKELDATLYGEIDRYSKIYKILGFKEDPTDDIIDKLSNLSEEQMRKILEYLAPRVEEYDPTAANNDEWPTEDIPVDINRFTESTIKTFCDAKYVEFADVTRSVRISGGGDRENTEYRYGGFCQKCHNVKGHWEIAEMFLYLNPRKELEQMYLSLCPNCAAEYRQLRNNPAIMSTFKQALINSHYGDSEVKLTDNIDIYFTQKHLAEIKIILEKMEENNDTASINTSTLA